MGDAKSQELGLLAKLVIALATMLIIAGIVWHGFTVETLERFWRDMTQRPSGPMKFRFVLQPLMAVIVAIHDGVRDARTGRSPYLWTILWHSRDRGARLREGINATARIILLGIAMDVIYQILVLRMLYPGEALFVALLLAFVPYLFIRGPVARALRWYWAEKTNGTKQRKG